MTQYKKFLQGLYISASSFSILWKYKKLILYLGLPIITKSIMALIVYNLSVDPASFKMPFFTKEPILLLMKIAGSQNWISFATLFFINVTFLIIITIATIALTSHTDKIIQHKEISIKKVFSTVRKEKIKKAIIWSLIVFIPIVIKNYAHTIAFLNKKTISWIPIVVFVAWSLATAFVIQVIALENVSIIDAIKKSISTIKGIFTDYLGAIFWLGFITLFSLMPLVLLERYLIPRFKSQILVITAYIMIMIISCIIPTAYTISKTILYRYFKNMNLGTRP